MKTQNWIIAGTASLLMTTSAFATSITAAQQAQVMHSGALTAQYGQGGTRNNVGGPPPATDLGSLNGDTSLSVTVAPNEVAWFSFLLDGATYLDITTSFGAGPDSEMGLFSATGALIANDDDDGVGLLSTLSFGTGSGLMLGDSFNLGGDGIANGEDGPLAAGLYYLALGEFNVDFADGFVADSTGIDAGGTWTLDFFTDASAPIAMPEPMSLLLVGAGLLGVAAARRRRS